MGTNLNHPFINPEHTSWTHRFGPGYGNTRIHFIRKGQGEPVLLLHGWPGFWYDWRHVIPKLSASADVIAIDFRGFGQSDKPQIDPLLGYTPEVLAKDITCLLDYLNITSVTVAAHDIGATVAQTLAAAYPERVRSLVLLNPPYPGIGLRRFEPDVQRELWYQHLHNLDLIENVIGYNSETASRYVLYFYNHWCGKKEALNPAELKAIADVYGKPGALAGSIQYYRARAASKTAAAISNSPPAKKIVQKTSVLWGEKDPLIRSEWSDRLEDFFTKFSLQRIPDVGHFLPFEAPDEVLGAIQEYL